MDAVLLVGSQVTIILVSYAAGFYMAYLTYRPKRRAEPGYLGRKKP